MPDRYADAVRARRVELRARREQLGGGHRAALRSCLALSRLTATADAATALGELAREAREYADAGDRAARQRLPGMLASAVDEVAVEVHTRWVAQVRPALRRIATERGADPGVPSLPAPHLPALLRAPAEVSGEGSSVAAGTAGGIALRFTLVLPLLGLPTLGGRALVPLAVGAGVAAVITTVRARRAAAERVLLRRHVDEVLAAARTAIEADLGRRLVELEHTAGAALDAAIAPVRARVDAELALLSSGPGRSA
ncbi:hypothetical protein [Pseudonocardia nigra]|uniref:hypothetical protein n=1 Tax=Pseudonocardia nigra TaxID=1921578 RepID=UPI001C5E4C99|nr:hypothetical protein [Pseudonocardia nigra]